jgi:tRNA threonylcarbamoyladenosine biosynthesis protein TsaB
MECAKRILAIETSGRHGSVAALWGEAVKSRLLGQVTLAANQRTAQALMPAIEQLLAESDWPPASVELVAVAVGPGSFTGLRIGVTAAKTLAYALSAEVIGVNTLEALAVQAPTSAATLWAVLDAQRQELFAARFAMDGSGRLRAERDTHIVSQETWLAGLQVGDRVTGTALGRLAARLPKDVVIMPQEFWQPMAAAVGQIGWKSYLAGRRDDVWKLAPLYFRPSAAEEKRDLSAQQFPPRS